MHDPGPAAHDMGALLQQLFILFVAAKVGAEIFERLRQPAVVGEILAGVIVGPQVLGLIRPDDATFALSELGVLFLLFLVGLETNPSDLLRVGGKAMVVAVGGVVLPFLLGYGTMHLLGESFLEGLFVGTALVATSVGITARVLGRMGLLHLQASRIILGAAIIDDILGLLVLAVVASFRSGTIDYRQIGLTAFSAIAFTTFMLFLGGRVIQRTRPAVERLRIGHEFYVFAIGLCLALAVAAGRLGVAAIIGAFLAGMALSEVSEETGLHQRFEGLAEFFVPFFLTGIGAQLEVASLAKPSILALAVGLTVLAILGKVVGCGVPVWRQGTRMALQVGIGMAPRGEVGIVVAQLGLAQGVLNADLFAVVLFVAIATTMIAPPILTRLFAGEMPLHLEPAVAVGSEPGTRERNMNDTDVGIDLE
jgi:Kef-type K+ transport system membrane component KefB